MSRLDVVDDVLTSFAAEVGDEGPVAVVGNRTRWELGGVVEADARLLPAPEGIIEYRPEEMIVRVRAGTSIDELHRELAQSKQRTALPERGGTVGGAIVVGQNHLQTLGRGPIRNAVLQVRYVSADGRLISGGGATVKNVSGFDLPRLLVGSLGTLGLLAEVILRTNPVPSASVWLSADDADPFEVFDSLLRPSAVLWDGSMTFVNLEGHVVDVEAETDKIESLGSFTETTVLPDLPAERWSLRPGDLRTLDPHITGGYVASIGVGTVFADHPQPSRDPDPVVTLVSERMKQQFDPTGRLNPGRMPGRR